MPSFLRSPFSVVAAGVAAFVLAAGAGGQVLAASTHADGAHATGSRAAQAEAPHAHPVGAAGKVSVEGGYTFAPRPGVPNIGIYFDRVHNSGDEVDQLLSAAVPFEAKVELHEMKMEGDVMRMHEVPAIEVPAGGSVDMRRGASYHVMVIGLKQPLKAGDHFDLTLRFKQAGEQTVRVQVREFKRAGAHHHGGKHHGAGGHGHAGKGAGHAGH